MNLYCNGLALNCQVISDQVSKDIFTKQYHASFESEKILHPEFLFFLDRLNLETPYVESFYSPPNFETSIHIDLSGGDYTKINYIWGGANSEMHWYIPRSSIQKEATISAAGTPYLVYEPNEVYRVESVAMHSPSLVQVGIPHKITNPSEYRLCLSIVITHKKTQQRVTMLDAIKIFKNYIVAPLDGIEPPSQVS